MGNPLTHSANKALIQRMEDYITNGDGEMINWFLWEWLADVYPEEYRRLDAMEKQD